MFWKKNSVKNRSNSSLFCTMLSRLFSHVKADTEEGLSVCIPNTEFSDLSAENTDSVSNVKVTKILFWSHLLQRSHVYSSQRHLKLVFFWLNPASSTNSHQGFCLCSCVNEENVWTPILILNPFRLFVRSFGTSCQGKPFSLEPEALNACCKA